jgi:hypothetical protein
MRAIVVLLIAQSASAWHAFYSPQLTKRCMRPSLRMSVKHLAYSFDFPDAPIERGIRQLHSPYELFAPMGSLLRIENVTEPVLSPSNITAVSFVCRSVFGRTHTVRLYTARRDMCGIVVYDQRKRPCMLATAHATPLLTRDPYNFVLKRGHTLQINATTKANGVSMSLPLTAISLAWGETNAIPALMEAEPTALAKYRRIALSLY